MLCTQLETQLNALSRTTQGGVKPPPPPSFASTDDEEVDLGPNGYYDEVSHDGGAAAITVDNDDDPRTQPLFPFQSAAPAGYEPRLRRYFRDDISLLGFPPQEFQVSLCFLHGVKTYISHTIISPISG